MWWLRVGAQTSEIAKIEDTQMPTKRDQLNTYSDIEKAPSSSKLKK